MKKKFAKFSAFAFAAVFAVSVFSMTALADSPNSSNSNTETNEAQAAAQAEATNLAANVAAEATTFTTADGQTVTVTPAITPAPVAAVAAAKEQAKTLVSASANVLKVMEVSLPNISNDQIPAEGIPVTFEVPGVVAGQKLAVLHQKTDGTWEKLGGVKVENGKITATFHSFSPVAIVSESTSAKTGSSFPLMAVLAVLALGGAAICARKYVA